MIGMATWVNVLGIYKSVYLCCCHLEKVISCWNGRSWHFYSFKLQCLGSQCKTNRSWTLVMQSPCTHVYLYIYLMYLWNKLYYFLWVWTLCSMHLMNRILFIVNSLGKFSKINRNNSPLKEYFHGQCDSLVSFMLVLSKKVLTGM